AVAEAHRRDARHEVEVLAAVQVPDASALPPHERDRQPLSSRQEVLLLQLDPVLFFAHEIVVPVICPSMLCSRARSTRPSTTRHLRPAPAASRHARTFGIIPPSITPPSISALAC